MRGAVAIGGAKPGEGRLRAGQAGDSPRPSVLPAARIGREPDGNQLAAGAQGVDMPVRTLRYSDVVPEARGQSARTEGAADVDVEPGLQAQESEAPNGD